MESVVELNLKFYKNRNVLITGHTGFKGTWLSRILIEAGANVTGYALEPSEKTNLFDISGIQSQMRSIIGDIRDCKQLNKVFDECQPEIVLHLAAQPLVRLSYIKPRYTYETNVMGTVNVCEGVRLHPCVKSFLNVTTDKVYKNNEWDWGYRENEPLDGYDPYSNSKSCSELVTHSYINSFFNDMGINVSTARAGNVIGGGDFSQDRIIPDCFRAVVNKEKIIVRNPYSVRPYQHVFEPLMVYLLIAAKQFEDSKYCGYYNVGPNEYDCVTTGQLVELFCQKWGDGCEWTHADSTGPHEANFLKLDCSKIKNTFHWQPVWNVEQMMEKTVEWYKTYLNHLDIKACMDNQIKSFFKL